MQQQLYDHAKQAFTKAGRQYEARVAEAFRLRGIAQASHSTGVGRNTIRSKAFDDAARAFIAIAPDGGPRRAAYYADAAACLVEVPDCAEAARKFLLAENYDKAATMFRNQNMFDDAADVVVQYERGMSVSTTQRVRYACGLHYLLTKKIA